MPLKNFVFILFGFYGLSLFSFKHSDEQMKHLINVSKESAIKVRNLDCPMYRLRCPYYDEQDSYKEALIEKGFRDGLYSQAIRDELVKRKMYPMIPIDLDNRPYVNYFCEF